VYKNHNKEITDVLMDKATAHIHVDGDKPAIVVNGMQCSFSKIILDVEKLIKEIAQSSEILFARKTDAKNLQIDRFFSRPAGKLFISLLNIDMEEIDACFANSTFNSYFEVFRKNINDFHLKDTVSYHQMLHGEDLAKWVEALNACIDSIRKTVRSKDFSTAIKTLQRGINKNHQSLLDYIDALFACHSRLLVLRIDFGYKTESLYGKDFQTSVDFPEIKNQHNLLMRHLKTKMFKNAFIGFASKFEYGLMKGYHFHSLLFLDGSQKRTDVLIAKMIGDYWNTVLTKGNGTYYNCNALKEKYQDLGIGMINYSDEGLMVNLKERVAPYLNKTDYFIKLVTTGKDRAFIRGNMPKAKTEKRGRPRSKAKSALPRAEQATGSPADN
jgi:hypothetical protein